MGITSSSFSSLQDTGKASLKKSYSDAFKAFCNVARCVFRINRDFSAKLNQNQAVEDPFDATQFQQVRVSARTRCSYTKWRKRRYSILFGRPIILEISILRYFELLGETWPSKWAATLQVTCLERKGAERMAGAHAPAMHSSAACRRFGADLARIKFVDMMTKASHSQVGTIKLGQKQQMEHSVSKGLDTQILGYVLHVSQSHWHFTALETRSCRGAWYALKWFWCLDSSTILPKILHIKRPR